jgi:hypothetical protein
VHPITFGQVVCAVVEIRVLGQHAGNHWLVTARVSKSVKRGNQLMNLFVTLKYDSNALNLDELDVVLSKPAYVISASTLRSQTDETEYYLWPFCKLSSTAMTGKIRREDSLDPKPKFPKVSDKG